MADPIRDTQGFAYVHKRLLQYPAPVLPPPKVHDPALCHQISSLSLHPVLETTLHILNGDLPSAHFLVRHMQAEPAFEAMYLHGILHRVEGDYANARAWYRNVEDSEVFRAVWPEGNAAATDFIARIEKLRKQREGDIVALQKESRREIEAVINFGREKFGEAEVRDASDIWVQPSKEHKDMSSAMIIGGEGGRTF